MTLTASQLADALGYFSNEALSAMHSGTADVACIASGVISVVHRLEEIAKGEAGTGPVAFYVNIADMETAKRLFGYAGHVGFDGFVRISDLPGEGRMPVYAHPEEEPGETVGEAVAWQRRLSGSKVKDEGWHMVSREVAAYAIEHGHPEGLPDVTCEVRPLYAHPVEEPGELERLTRERDEIVARCRRAVADRIGHEVKIGELEAALAKTRERLDKMGDVSNAGRDLWSAIGEFLHNNTRINNHERQLLERSREAFRTALSTQESSAALAGGTYVADAERYPG